MPPDDVMQVLERAARAEDRETLFATLEAVRPRLGSDPRVAGLWAEGLRTTPLRPSLREEAETILEGFPAEPALVLAVTDALLRRAERRPMDEPPEDDGPAVWAASAAKRCFDKLSAESAKDPEVGGRLLAQYGNALGLLGDLRRADAVETLERALALDPERGAWYGDLARIHKLGRRFEASLEAATRAVERLQGAEGALRGARWNVAIAALACGEGERAAREFEAMGLPVRREAGYLPLVEGLPPLKVRLPTLGTGTTLPPVPDQAASFEVVWVQPLSPCHGVVRSPTLRAAIADFGDTILFDGTPVAVQRGADGEPVPTMPLLGVLVPGTERRFPFLALQQRPEQVQSLADALGEVGRLIQMGERVEVVCPRCAAGERYTRHEHAPAESHRVAFGKLIVEATQDLASVSRAIESAKRDHSGVRLAVPALYEALGDAKRAGAHHKRWGEIERTTASTGSR